MQTPDADWSSELRSGLGTMGVALEARQCRQLLDYLALLSRWNRAFNLTAVRDPAQLVSRHLLDSLSILPWIDAGPVLDVGTGAGLPGLPLAIACPRLRFTLLDANGKRTRFVQQAVAELGVGNVEVFRGRVEQLGRPGGYARIVSRAFAALADMVTATSGLLAGQGRWLAMKGAYPRTELSRLPATVRSEVFELSVPGEVGARHLVILTPTGEASRAGTPDGTRL